MASMKDNRLIRCLVLGGNGFIGSHLVDALLLQGYLVRVFDRPRVAPYRYFDKDEKVEWYPGEFNSVADIETAVQDCQIIYHLISTTLPKTSNDDPIYDVDSNVIGALRLFNAARHAGVKKIIFISSGGTVYGVPRQVPISEDHSTDPISSYGISKLSIEKYLSLYRELHGMDYVVLRVANPYGERQRVEAAQGAIAVFLHKAMADQAIEIWGDGSVVRDFIYISDVVSALLKAIDHNGDVRLFNIGSGIGRSLNDILSAIEEAISRPVRRVYKPGRVFDVPANVLDINKARQHLGWHPQVSLEVGIGHLYRWLSGTRSQRRQ